MDKKDEVSELQAKKFLDNISFDDLKSLLENFQVPVSITTFEKDPVYVYVNNLFLEFLGLTREVFDSKQYYASDFFDKDNRSNLTDEILNNLKVGQVRKFTFEMVSAEGEHVYINDNNSVISLHGKKYFMSAYKNITYEHAQAELIKQQDKKISNVKEFISGTSADLLCGVIRFDNTKDFNILYSNTYASKAFGYESKEYFESSEKYNLREYLNNEKLTLLTATLTKLEDLNDPVNNVEVSFINNVGAKVWLYGYFREVMSQEGKLIYQYVFLDISHTKEATEKLAQANKKFKLSCELSKTYIVEYDYISHEFKIINGIFKALTEVEPGHYIFNPNLIAKEYVAEVGQFFRKVTSASSETGKVEFKYDLDYEKWSRFEYQVITDDNDIPLTCVIVGSDITKLVKARKHYDIELKLRKVLSQDSIGLCDLDYSDRKIVNIDGKLFDSALHPLETFDDIRNFFDRIVHPDDFHNFNKIRQSVKQQTKDHKEIEGSLDCRILVAVRQYHYVRVNYSIMTNPYDGNSHVIAVFHDVDKQVKERIKMIEKANKDALTDLHNRSSFEANAKQSISEVLAEDNVCTFLLIDIDDFKNVNDQRGHIQGDILLRKMAALLKSTFKVPNLVGRLGGDEFVALLTEDTDLDNIVDKTESFRKKFRDLGYSEDEVSCSVGICMSDRFSHTYEELYAHADKAMYRAKRTGKDCTVVYDPSIDFD